MLRKALFFEESNENRQINPYLSFANANLGYTLVQAIIEYVDNAIDAHASEISICFWRDKILIIDNGDGLDAVKKFFDVENIPRRREKKEIGLFNCGSFSAFSVADVCSFISRKELYGEPRGISIFYDQKEGGIENDVLDVEFLEKWFKSVSEKDAIFKSWKSIVVIESIHPEKNNIHLQDEADYLYARMGQRYLEKIIKKSLCIKIWDMQTIESGVPNEAKIIQFVDPTFYNERNEEIRSFHRDAFRFSITMREIALEIGEFAVDRYYEKYRSHYSDNISREDFGQEELVVKYFVLKPIKECLKFVKENKRYKHYEPGGRSLSTGFYVYRNGIGIGDAAIDKKMAVDFKRQEFNRFKAIIESTPAFDELLGINIRKDDFEVVEALTHILEKKLQESIKNFFASIPDGDKYEARKLGSYIRNLFDAVDECELEREVVLKKDKVNVKDEEETREYKIIDKSELEARIHGILKFSSLLTQTVKEKVNEWENTHFTSDSEYRNILIQANDVLEELLYADKSFLQDLDNILTRVVENQSRRILFSSKYSFLSGIDEPRNEQETVFLLLRILENSSIIKSVKELGLNRVFAYDISKGIDFVGKTTESDEEYKANFNSILASCEYLDAEKICDKYKLIIDYHYLGVELKYVINNGMSIGHSLATSRFLVAWKITVGTDGGINAYDGMYYKVMDSNQDIKGIYTYENSSSKHKIKVIVLKEWGIWNDVFEVRNKSNRL